MRLADNYLRRAGNCTIGCIDGKVKCRKNYTLTWLVSKPSDEQRKLGKKLNLVLNNNAELSEVLPELSIEQTETVRNVVSNMSILNGLYIEELWFTEQKQNILYHRHIISVKNTGKIPKATICYWTQEDIKEEGEIKNMHITAAYWLCYRRFCDFPDLWNAFFIEW